MRDALAPPLAARASRVRAPARICSRGVVDEELPVRAPLLVSGLVAMTSEALDAFGVFTCLGCRVLLCLESGVRAVARAVTVCVSNDDVRSRRLSCGMPVVLAERRPFVVER